MVDKISNTIIESLLQLANKVPIRPRDGCNPLSGTTEVQTWAAQMLGVIGTIESVNALADVHDWDIRHEGFKKIKSSTVTSIIIEMLHSEQTAYSAATALGSINYSDKSRDALISCIESEAITGQTTVFNRAFISLASIASEDTSNISIEFILKWDRYYCDDRYLFDAMKGLFPIESEAE